MKSVSPARYHINERRRIRTEWQALHKQRRDNARTVAQWLKSRYDDPDTLRYIQEMSTKQIDINRRMQELEREFEQHVVYDEKITSKHGL